MQNTAITIANQFIILNLQIIAEYDATKTYIISYTSINQIDQNTASVFSDTTMFFQITFFAIFAVEIEVK